PVSGNKHDYYSFGPYWWPNPDSKNGMPYIRKDGQINPDSKTNGTDSKRMVQFSDDVRALALAWFYSGEDKYAKKAQQLLQAWFLD
ncbi:alginate lyase family protein, partial [Enterococcus faecium]|uniref:alginate lyase family protein n=3 Tax=Bacteria TaxID=2 RepID=UPI0039FC0875